MIICTVPFVKTGFYELNGTVGKLVSAAEILHHVIFISQLTFQCCILTILLHEF